MCRHASRDSRGAVAAGAVVVNAALVAPLLVLIVLGIVEMASLMKDNVALSSLVRQSGRAAVSSVVVENGRSPAPTELTSVAIARAESALRKDSIEEIWIYKADAQGLPVGNPAGDPFTACATDCISYAWDADARAFRFAGGQWGAGDIDACSDDIGVYMKADHALLSGVFSQTIGISKHETFKLAPSDGDGCRLVTS
jgi:hypothetical protein